MVADVAGERGADRGTDADKSADDALPEVEMAGAAGEIGDDEGHHDAEYSGGHPIEELHDDEQFRIRHRREENAANGQRGEADQQQRAAAPDLRSSANPRR